VQLAPPTFAPLLDHHHREAVSALSALLSAHLLEDPLNPGAPDADVSTVTTILEPARPYDVLAQDQPSARPARQAA
jgi:hypothetical protein